MNRAHPVHRTLLIAAAWLLLAPASFAPLIYTPGEGWRYEPVGETGKWARGNAREQLQVAKDHFEQKKYSTSLRAARRVVNVWPFSDYAPEAQYLIGRCQEARHRDEAAFKGYQRVIERYPKLDNYNEIVLRQFEIANRFLAGQWFRLWGLIPLYPSMDKTIKLYEQIIKNGPHSDVAPQAQLNIAQAYLNKVFKDYYSAAKAYETAADRYSDKKAGIDALYLAGETYYKQAYKAEYDQSVAGQAIGTFSDFITLHPADERVPKARESIQALRTEQARGSFAIARFYEKRRRWDAALIYFNEVLLKDPESTLATNARERIDAIKNRRNR